MRLNQSWKSEVHQIVEARVVHVLSCWCEILLEVRKLSRILSAAVNVFTFTKFKSTSKHSKVFFTSVFKNSFLMKSLELFLYIKPVLLIRERQFAFVYNDVFLRYQVQVFSSPWRIYRCVTANMKTIKTQSEPNPIVFPFEALEKTSHMTSSVTAPTVTWPALRKQSIVQAKEVYSKCLFGIKLLIEVRLGWRSLRHQALVYTHSVILVI